MSLSGRHLRDAVVARGFQYEVSAGTANNVNNPTGIRNAGMPSIGTQRGAYANTSTATTTSLATSSHELRFITAPRPTFARGGSACRDQAATPTAGRCCVVILLPSSTRSIRRHVR